MFKVKHNTNEIVRVLEWLQRSIIPQRVIVRALKSATGQAKAGYARRWQMEMGWPQESLWQKMKQKHGFLGELGFFTGSTYSSIGSRVLGTSKEKAHGEVSVYGVWPNKIRSTEPVDDASEGWWDVDPVRGQADSFALAQHGLGAENIESDRLQGSNIRYVAGGIEVTYPRGNSYVIKSEDMRMKRYGPKRKGAGVDFMYLNPSEENTIFSDVVNIISQSIDRL